MPKPDWRLPTQSKHFNAAIDLTASSVLPCGSVAGQQRNARVAILLLPDVRR